MSADRLELKHQIVHRPDGRDKIIVGTTADGIHTTESPGFPPSKGFPTTPKAQVGVRDRITRFFSTNHRA